MVERSPAPIPGSTSTAWPSPRGAPASEGRRLQPRQLAQGPRPSAAGRLGRRTSGDSALIVGSLHGRRDPECTGHPLAIRAHPAGTARLAPWTPRMCDWPCTAHSSRPAGRRRPASSGTAWGARCGVTRLLAELHAARHIVLDPNGRDVVMAHPFSAVPLGFSVMGATTLWWGGCAWDSFALPHVVPGDDEVVVATTCPACSTAHAWLVDAASPPPGNQLAHFLVPAAHVGRRGPHPCPSTPLLRRVHRRLARADRQPRGRRPGPRHALAARRRAGTRVAWSGATSGEPTAAREYFAEVGLRGSFWGL